MSFMDQARPTPGPGASGLLHDRSAAAAYFHQASLPGRVRARVTPLSPVGGCGVGNLTEPVAVALRHWAEGAQPVAAWWSPEGPGGAGGWSTEGCQLRSSQPNVSSLHCQHLGSVAVLMVSGAGQGAGRGQGVSAR